MGGRSDASTGRRGEDMASSYLRDSGYEILARNYRFGRCEIDIVARKGNTLVFVEVKTRRSRSFGHPILSVTASKTRNIVKTAGQFIERTGLDSLEVRFDVITVMFEGGEHVIEHIADAFRPW
jgi:putative endonuclease